MRKAGTETPLEEFEVANVLYNYDVYRITSITGYSRRPNTDSTDSLGRHHTTFSDSRLRLRLW